MLHRVDDRVNAFFRDQARDRDNSDRAFATFPFGLKLIRGHHPLFRNPGHAIHMSVVVRCPQEILVILRGHDVGIAGPCAPPKHESMHMVYDPALQWRLFALLNVPKGGFHEEHPLEPVHPAQRDQVIAFREGPTRTARMDHFGLLHRFPHRHEIRDEVLDDRTDPPVAPHRDHVRVREPLGNKMFLGRLVHVLDRATDVEVRDIIEMRHQIDVPKLARPVLAIRGSDQRNTDRQRVMVVNHELRSRT